MKGSSEFNQQELKPTVKFMTYLYDMNPEIWNWPYMTSQ